VDLLRPFRDLLRLFDAFRDLLRLFDPLRDLLRRLLLLLRHFDPLRDLRDLLRRLLLLPERERDLRERERLFFPHFELACFFEAPLDFDLRALLFLFGGATAVSSSSAIATTAFLAGIF